MSCLSGLSFVQLLDQTFNLLSLPTIHLLPLLRVSMPLFIVAHIGEQGSLFAFEAILLLWLQYFIFKTWTQGASLLVWNLQFSLERRAIFLHFADCNPMPLSSLVLVTLSHPTQWIFLIVSEDPQRKFRLTLSKPSKIMLGR